MAERLGHILLRHGVIDQQKLDFCLKVQRNNGGDRLGKVLRHYDFVTEEHIAQGLAEQSGWKKYSGTFVPDLETMAKLGMEFALKHMVLAVKEKNQTVFLMAKTDDIAATDFIQNHLKQKADFRIVPEGRLRQALESIYSSKEALYSSNAGKEDLAAWLDAHMNLAVAKGATDIHIEASQKAVEVRFRVDGILHSIDCLRLEMLSRLVNIVFHKAEVAISDFKHVHDGRFTHTYLNRTVDVRVSHIPSVHGSSLVLRLLDKNKTNISLPALGYGPAQWDVIQNNLIKPEGMVLIVGPTGSGKTTTLYAMLNALKSISRKIVSVEDPVEMHLPLMTQVQTNERREITFNSMVRAFLRHDPNILFIGEIRDKQTAQEAMRATMTGHKVFATVHANRPVDALLRLNDLGVPYLHMSGNVNMIIGQRLVRCLCPSCKVEYVAYASELPPYEAKYVQEDRQRLFKANGCTQCVHGFKARTVASEVLSFNQTVEDFVGEGNIQGLRRYLAGDKDYVTLIEDGRRLVKEGITSISEAVRVLG